MYHSSKTINLTIIFAKIRQINNNSKTFLMNNSANRQDLWISVVSGKKDLWISANRQYEIIDTKQITANSLKKIDGN